MNIFNDPAWGMVPFHFWTSIFFVLGAIVGSLLNVCIYRMPRGESIIWPPSHCPHCNYKIPGYLNIPLITWTWLRGKCANCKAAISVRYLLVELLTGIVFAVTWMRFGSNSVGVALVYCLLLAAFIVATFIDLEHFIIPDEITLGGIGVGLLCSAIVPALHRTGSRGEAMWQSFLGILVGGGIIYLIVRGGKLLFGRYRIALAEPARVFFTETELLLPNEKIPYEEVFYRKSDRVVFQAEKLELIDRCYLNVPVSLSPQELRIADEKLDPETVPHMEAITGELSMPREAMGLGDVKFMAAIGAFLGWQATVFSLMASSVVGLIITAALNLLRGKELSGSIPYGPYIALAAVIWMFAPDALHNEVYRNLEMMRLLLTGKAPVG